MLVQVLIQIWRNILVHIKVCVELDTDGPSNTFQKCSNYFHHSNYNTLSSKCKVMNCQLKLISILRYKKFQ